MPLAPAEAEQEETIECDDKAEDDPEEVQDSKVAPSPSLPSKAEVEEHRITHLPFRSWCKECIMGKALGEQRSSKHPPSKIAIIGIDYFFMTKDGLVTRDELASEYSKDAEGNSRLTQARNEGNIVKCVIIRCSATKMIFAHVVPVKGADDDGQVCDLVASGLQFIGHTKLIVRADGEPALQKLLTETIKRLRIKVEDLDTISRERPEPYESQSNGLIEVGVRVLRAQFRTMRACLECRIGRVVPVDHPVSAWLLEHCCLLLNALKVGDDGQTAWMRARGRPFRPRLVGFCETVLYKLPVKGPRHDVGGNMAPRWAQGLFVGYNRSTNGYLIATKEGLKSSRALMRRPFENRWDLESISGVRCTPWSSRAPLEGPQPDMEPSAARHDQFPDPGPALPRRFKIVKSDLERHGYSKDCAQCDHVVRHGVVKPGLQHTEVCRARIMAEVAKDPRGQARLQATEERVNRALAERIEWGVAQT